MLSVVSVCHPHTTADSITFSLCLCISLKEKKEKKKGAGRRFVWNVFIEPGQEPNILLLQSVPVLLFGAPKALAQLWGGLLTCS